MPSCIIMLNIFLLLSPFQLITNSALNLRHMHKLRLEKFENVIFLPNAFGSVYIVTLQRMQKSLIQPGFVDCLVCRELKIGVFPGNGAQLDALYDLSTLLK